jgi:hypothetical protein
MHCADFGSIVYGAYQLDAVSGSYRRVILRERGDDWRDNSAPAAADLADWLKQSCAAVGFGSDCQ